ncbi:MAG: M3 family oligoendopeptidase [Phycisphaerales bacterium]
MSSSTSNKPASHAPASTFVPANLDGSRWEALEPYYSQLVGRTVHDAAALERLLLDRSELDAAAEEAAANLYISMTRHTDDELARKRYLEFVETVEPELKKVGFALDRKIAECPFAGQLDQTRYGVLLRAMRRSVEIFREANIPLETESTKLDQKYSEINGAMTVEFEGQERTLPQMARFLEETDRTRRQKSWEAVAQRRLRDADQINDLFDQMIRLRHQIALNAGFPNFRDYQHARMQRFDYTPADCERFHEGAEKVCVPLLRQLNAERAKSLGVSPLRPWDLKVDLHGRAPLSPFSTAAELVDRSSAIFHRMDPELGRMFDSMRTGDCLDLESRKGKAPGGYQYQRQRSRTPFIFMNAAGLHRDVITMVHEAGHAFHSLLCAHDPLVGYRGSPMEFAEVASMSMELLTFPHLDAFYSPVDADRARRDHLEGLSTTLPWIATIDAFQHWIYLHPTHTRKDREQYWLHLNDRFGAAVDWSGYEEALRTLWHRQLHVFGIPFYYIEYGIAQIGALQMWLQARRDPAQALANYKRGLSLGGSRPLPELFRASGLKFSFGPDTMGELMEEVGRDLAKLPA